MLFRSPHLLDPFDRYVMVEGDWYETINEGEYERLLGQVSGSLSVHHFVKETEKFSNSTGMFLREIRDDVLEDVSLVAPASDMSTWLGRRVKFDDRTIFSVRTDSMKKMGMLKHQSEVEGLDVWEDKDDEQWAVMMTAKVDKVKPSTYRWFDEEVIPHIMDNMARHEYVTRTRVMDCEREYSEEGVCYDL